MKRPGKYNRNNQIKLVAHNQIMNLQIRAIRQQQSEINERNFKKKYRDLHHANLCTCCNNDKAFSLAGSYHIYPNRKILNEACPYVILLYLDPLGKQTIELHFTPVTN